MVVSCYISSPIFTFTLRTKTKSTPSICDKPVDTKSVYIKHVETSPVETRPVDAEGLNYPVDAEGLKEAEG